jgi:poly(A) polymerase
MTPDDGEAKALAERLRLSNADRDRIVEAKTDGPRIVSWMSPREARRAIYAIGPRAFRDQVKLAWAASERASTAPQWRALLALAETWTPPALPLSGEEILKAGVPKGPMVGKVMREVELWWIDQDFIEDKFSVIERLKAVAQGMVY